MASALGILLITGSAAHSDPLFEELFTNEMPANLGLTSIEWRAFAGMEARDVTAAKREDLTAGIFLASAAGNPAAPTGFLACGLMNELGINEYAAIRTDLNLSQPGSFTWRMNATPGSKIMVRLLVQVNEKWFASSREMSPTVLGGPGQFPAASVEESEVQFPFSRDARDWHEFELESGIAMAVGDACKLNLPNDPVTGVGFYVSTTSQTPSMLRLDTLRILP
jgi:hypothetical protein